MFGGGGVCSCFGAVGPAMIGVASYCRVSTDKEDQANSFDAQQRYFTQYISQHPQWELRGIYADQGITGTSAQKRPQFLRMIEDAKAGRFGIILTKEVSRFSRNLLDTIAYTRKLKSFGVFVIFLTDGISTQEPDAELRLSIMASMAQEESRKTSARVKWGQTRQMERGVVFGHSMLGYDVKNGVMAVNAEGAKLVQRIFHMYAVERLGSGQIARALTEEGIATPTGNPVWTPGYILKILKNEKYIGDLVQKKSYTPDFLTHQKRQNHGEEPMVILKGHHVPIISRHLWDMAQRERRRRQIHPARGASVQHALSGKIQCGVCGANFVARQKRSSGGAAVLRWSCATAVRGGNCGIGRLLRDDEARHMLHQALEALKLDGEAVVTSLLSVIEQSRAGESRQRREAWERLQHKKEAVMDAYFSGEITAQDMRDMKERYQKQQERLADKPEAWETTLHWKKRKGELSQVLYALIQGEMESDALCRMLIHQIVVFPDRHVELSLLGLPHVFSFSKDGV